jgi:hypothetical protein
LSHSEFSWITWMCGIGSPDRRRWSMFEELLFLFGRGRLGIEFGAGANPPSPNVHPPAVGDGLERSRFTSHKVG